MDAAQDIESTWTLPRRSMRCLVVLLFGSTGDDGKPVDLLPRRRLTAAILPIVGRCTWATDGCNNIGSGIVGKVSGEAHGQNLPRKNKSAMPKIILAIRRQCRQITCMSNNQNIQLTRKHTHNGVQFGYSKKHGWMLQYSCAYGCGWIPCVPKHIQ